MVNVPVWKIMNPLQCLPWYNSLLDKFRRSIRNGAIRCVVLSFRTWYYCLNVNVHFRVCRFFNAKNILYTIFDFWLPTVKRKPLTLYRSTKKKFFPEILPKMSISIYGGSYLRFDPIDTAITTLYTISICIISYEIR